MTIALPIPAASPVRTFFWSALGLALDLPWAHLAARPPRSEAPAAIALDPARELDAVDVREALGGDERAFERIVRRHQQEIARRLRRFSRDPLVLEELVQETFVQAYFSLGRYRSEAPLIHWLHRIAVRAGVRHWRARGSGLEHVSIGERVDVAAPAPHDTEIGAELDRVLARLSPRDRLVLTLLYLEGHDVAETARLTGWSRTLVKVQAHRARKRLKRIFERSGGVP